MNKPLTPEQIETIERYSRPPHSAATKAAYRSDEHDFAKWMSDKWNRHHLPATPQDVLLYIVDLEKKGRQTSTIGRRIACISHIHRQARLVDPTKDVMVRNAVRNIRANIGTKRNPPDALTKELVETLIATCPNTKAGLRDKTMVVVGFSAALRRSEVVNIDWEDISETERFLVLRIPKSKTDQECGGQEIRIPKQGEYSNKAEWMQQWFDPCTLIRQLGTTTRQNSGPMFRPISRWDRVYDRRLGDDGFARAIKKLAKRVGIKLRVSGNSLRSSFLTSAGRAGASALSLQRVSRHKHMNSLLPYVRDEAEETP